MSIKRNSSGKILRNSAGKIVNECAADECCLYPWPDPEGTPRYPPEDLPEHVVVIENGVSHTLTRVLGLFPEYYYSDGTAPDYSDEVRSIIAQSPVPETWRLTCPTIITTSVCLIGGYSELPGFVVSVEDPFSNTYLVDLGGGDTGTATRVPATNLCKWTGTSTALVPILLEYNSATFQFEVNGVAKDSDNSAPDAGTGNYGAYNVS